MYAMEYCNFLLMFKSNTKLADILLSILKQFPEITYCCLFLKNTGVFPITQSRKFMQINLILLSNSSLCKYVLMGMFYDKIVICILIANKFYEIRFIESFKSEDLFPGY